MAKYLATQFVPEIFNHPIWEDKIEVRMFVSTKWGMTSSIEFNQDVWDTIQATNQANLKPFTGYRKTDSGRIEFSQINKVDKFDPERRFNIASPFERFKQVPDRGAINPAAMKLIHGFRDVRSAQANDKLDDESDDSAY